MSAYPSGGQFSYYTQPYQYAQQQQQQPQPQQQQQYAYQMLQTNNKPAADENTQKLHQLIVSLLNPEFRESALHELSKQRESFPDLAPTLWYSCGAIAVLLQEIVSVYPMLSPPTLQTALSNRVCNALSLLQCVAAHQATRTAFLQAHIPMFFYPFLNTASSERPFEYLRLTSLGAIGALVKSDDDQVITFLLGTEMVPLCLKIMENGSELSKTVATFVVQKILLFDAGLSYICATPERFLAVAQVLRVMVSQEDCSARLLRHIVRCYLRLTDHNRAREALKQTLPDQLRDNTFAQIIAEDANIKKWLFTLLVNVGDPGALQMEARQGQH